MTVRHQLTIASLCLIFVFTQVFAQNGEGQPYVSNVSNTGTTVAGFLEIGPGARAQALGAAFTSIADDATAMYWNPAGIPRLGHLEATFNYANWLVETQYAYAGVVAPIGSWGAVGTNVTYFDFGEQPVRTIDRPEGTGEVYGATDMAIGLAFGMNLTDRFSFGFNFKYINQTIWHESASGVAMDLGALYDTRLPGLRLGFSILNFGTDMKMSGRDLRRAYDPDVLHYGNDAINVNYETDAFNLPLKFRFGASYTIKFNSNNKLLIATDVVHPNNNSESINVGAEYQAFNMLYVRGGYEALEERDSINGLTAGGGIHYNLGGMNLLFDYAWVDWGPFNSVNRFSVGLAF